MRLRIRLQLLIPLLAILTGVIGLGAWTAVTAAERAGRRQIETHVRKIAQTACEAKFPLTDNVLQLIKGFSGADLVVFQEGKRFATLPVTAEELPATVNDNWQSLQLGPLADVKGQSYFCTGVRLPASESKAGGALYILYPEALWREALWQALRMELALMAGGGLASVLLAIVVAHRVGRRIADLERRTRLIAAGDFSPMPLPRWHDELHDLSQSVNEMAARLAQLQETIAKTERLRLLGQVSGGLAHQIRNGITGARLAMQVHARSGQADAEALDVALRQLTLVEKQLQRFLNLGKAEEPRHASCSVKQLIDETVGLVGPQCRHAHIELRWQPPASDAVVQADADQLGHLLLNILGNAVDAAGPGGSVDVTLEVAQAGRCIIAISDSGSGPTPEVAARLFEPFVTGKKDGVGLGLAVARQIAEAHGGQLEWRRENERTVFRISLPLAADTRRRGFESPGC
jgi:signal transduction histidine kinase